MPEKTSDVDIHRWIRKNIPASKLLEVREHLGLFSLDRKAMVSHLYRDLPRREAVEYAYKEFLEFLRHLLFLFSPEITTLMNDKALPDPDKIKDSAIKLAGVESVMLELFRLANTDVEGARKDNLAAERFLIFCVASHPTLNALVEIIERTLEDPSYELKNMYTDPEILAVLLLLDVAEGKGAGEIEEAPAL